MRVYMEISGSKDSDKLISEYIKYADKNSIRSEIILGGETTIIMFNGKEEKIKPLLTNEGIHESISFIPVSNENVLKISQDDLEFSEYRVSNLRGQYRSITSTGIKITHKPTGISVCCDNEMSQYKNKMFALEILQGKLQYYKLLC